MPRMARIVLPHYPHHVVLHGHNRQATFAERVGVLADALTRDRGRGRGAILDAVTRNPISWLSTESHQTRRRNRWSFSTQRRSSCRP